MSLAGEEGVPPLLSEGEVEGEEREDRSLPPHADPGFLGPDDPDVPVHNAADDPPDDEQSEDEPLVPPVSPPPLPAESDPEE